MVNKKQKTNNAVCDAERTRMICRLAICIDDIAKDRMFIVVSDLKDVLRTAKKMRDRKLKKII